MRIQSAHATDVGRCRENNEDRFLDILGLYAVADGMGGRAAGEVAASIAVEVIRRHADPIAKSAAGAETLRTAVGVAHSTILENIHRNSRHGGMGTTLTVLAVSDDKATIAHVGDSRCYRVRGGGPAEQLTKDHRSPFRWNVLSNCLGASLSSYNQTDITTFAIEPGDVFVLATDGLEQVDPGAIADVVRACRDRPQHGADRLIALALAAGGHDNVTVVIVAVSS